MLSENEFLSEAEAASLLGTKPTTLRVWWSTARKGPPRIKVGRKVIYRREALYEWLRSQEQSGAAATTRRRAA